MFKMTDTGGHHRHTVLVAVSKSKIVFHRAARLDDCRNTFFVCYFYAIREGEESICGSAE